MYSFNSHSLALKKKKSLCFSADLVVWLNRSQMRNTNRVNSCSRIHVWVQSDLQNRNKHTQFSKRLSHSHILSPEFLKQNPLRRTVIKEDMFSIRSLCCRDITRALGLCRRSLSGRTVNVLWHFGKPLCPAYDDYRHKPVCRERKSERENKENGMRVRRGKRRRDESVDKGGCNSLLFPVAVGFQSSSRDIITPFVLYTSQSVPAAIAFIMASKCPIKPKDTNWQKYTHTLSRTLVL